YVQQNFKALKPGHIDFEAKIGETSTDLKAVFSEEKPKSNDTSFGVGHAPFSPVEKVVRSLEQKLHGDIPEVGEDVKVMGLRNGDELELTVAAAVISSTVSTIEEYLSVVEEVREVAKGYAEELTELDVSVDVNAADRPEEDAVYLTVTGTSAEMGDDGSVGRGNRVNGLITPHRSMSLEAASGKNPRTHVGKLYNILANRISREIHEELGADYAEVKVLSRIGDPVNEPQAVEVQTTLDDRDAVEDRVERNLESVGDVTDALVRGEVKTF
ncbi:MAG: methionine adenosyltransferase, partial [Candidatus Nanohaloarchaea archaeon]